MSTDYIFLDPIMRSLKPIKVSEFFDGRLEAFGVCEHYPKKNIDEAEEVDKRRCLTDGNNNFLWVLVTDDGTVHSLTGYMLSDPTHIMRAICTAFDVEIFSEYAPQYWGFETVEEWDAAWDASAKGGAPG